MHGEMHEEHEEEAWGAREEEGWGPPHRGRGRGPGHRRSRPVRPPFGPPGFGAMGFGTWPGEPKFHRSRRVKRGDVRAAALSLLAEEPRNGYQIIQEIAERSGGVWQPSPGSVYPALQQLEDEGLIQAETPEGGRRRYALTDEGRGTTSPTAWARTPSSCATWSASWRLPPFRSSGWATRSRWHRPAGSSPTGAASCTRSWRPGTSLPGTSPRRRSDRVPPAANPDNTRASDGRHASV